MKVIEMVFFDGETIIKKNVNWESYDSRDYGILPDSTYFTAFTADTINDIIPIRNWLISERELNRKKLAEIIAKVTTKE